MFYLFYNNMRYYMTRFFAILAILLSNFIINDKKGRVNTLPFYYEFFVDYQLKASKCSCNLKPSTSS